MWYEWFFDGIGTEIITLITGLVIGGVTGYKIGVNRNGLQKQTAKDEAKQKQELIIDNPNKDGLEGGINGNLRQVQKAGKNVEQSQVGRIKR
ncbi:MAG: hypothetical protein HUJ68_09505 [Clostridia bacterium]|nr:hypothetical protein [Clostridia bacterium]